MRGSRAARRKTGAEPHGKLHCTAAAAASAAATRVAPSAAAAECCYGCFGLEHGVEFVIDDGMDGIEDEDGIEDDDEIEIEFVSEYCVRFVVCGYCVSFVVCECGGLQVAVGKGLVVVDDGVEEESKQGERRHGWGQESCCHSCCYFQGRE